MSSPKPAATSKPVGARLAREKAGAVSKHLQIRTTAIAGKVDRHPGRSNKVTISGGAAIHIAHADSAQPRIHQPLLQPRQVGDLGDGFADLYGRQFQFAQRDVHVAELAVDLA